jgi:hypothetical protein
MTLAASSEINEMKVHMTMPSFLGRGAEALASMHNDLIAK